MRVEHYTNEKDFVLKPIQIKNKWTKPTGGLWTSPVSSRYGWKKWCEENRFERKPYRVFLEIETSRLYEIDITIHLNKLPNYHCEYINRLKPDYEKIVENGIDAIHLTELGQELTRLSHPVNLYGWDCESVLILNERCILNIEKESDGSNS